MKSRYDEERKIIAHGDGWYTIEGKSNYYRSGFDNDGNKYYDFEGGPFLCEGFDFQGYGKIISLISEPCKSGYFKLRVETER